MDSREQAAAEAISALEKLVRRCVERRPGGHLVEHEIDRLAVELDLDLRAAERSEAVEPGTRERQLVGHVEELIDDAIQHGQLFRPGHAFCHRCDEATCEHSEPPTARDVFLGYSATGQPRWGDFAQRCLDLRHADVDRLYQPRPAFITMVQGDDQLHGRISPSFDRRRYRLLGQVIAGFYSTPVKAHEGRGVVAVTVQAALSRSRRGRSRIRLNLLARSPSGDSVEQLWERQDELPWRRALLWAQTAAATISMSRTVKGGRGERGKAYEGRVLGILKGLARRLERDHRARGRRTQHAQKRHASGSRPTGKALEDLRVASDEAFLIDRRSKAIVVLGGRGRTHFFSEEGKLVSSVRYSREAISKKLDSEQWQPVPPSRRDGLRKTLTNG